jgi:pimeloyl-ACP methyl ester carboxylesterase
MLYDFPDHYTTIDGLKVRYWDEGEGFPLILVPGVGVSIDTWAYNIKALSTKYRVIAFDIPGFGRSSRITHDGVYSLDYAGQFLYEFINNLGINRSNIAGNSMGGMLAIHLALNHPEMVEKLVLVDSAGLGKELGWSLIFMVPWPVGELLVHPTRLMVKMLAKALVYNHELVTDEWVNRMYEESNVPGTKEAMLKMLRSGVNLRGQSAAFSESVLRKVTQPVIVVWGKQDPAFPVKHAEFALRAIPNCRAVVLDKAGHPPQMDRADTFNRLMFEFLEYGRLPFEDAVNGKQVAFL